MAAKAAVLGLAPPMLARDNAAADCRSRRPRVVSYFNHLPAQNSLRFLPPLRQGARKKSRELVATASYSSAEK